MILLFSVASGRVSPRRGLDKTAPVRIQGKGRVEGLGSFVTVVHVLHVHGIGNFHVGIVVHAEVLERPSRRVMMADVDKNGDQTQYNDDDDGDGDGETHLGGRPLGRATCAGMGAIGITI